MVSATLVNPSLINSPDMNTDRISEISDSRERKRKREIEKKGKKCGDKDMEQENKKGR